MRHTISVFVHNKFGVLSRISGLFSGRAFNIESLTVAETTDPKISRMTIITRGDDTIIEQVIKQLRKLIDVVKVSDLTEEEFIARELMLIKVNTDEKTRAEVLRIADIFRAKIVDVTHTTYTLEITGNEDKIQAFIELLEPVGISEVASSGVVAIARSPKDEKLD
jgi:acetolactate synthase-1/3 small subunit